MKDIKVEISLTFEQVEEWCKANDFLLSKNSVPIPFNEIVKNDIPGILKNIHAYNGISAKEINIKTRKREIVESRQLAQCIAEKYLPHSLAYIGSEIGNKDHATVLNSKETVNNLIKTNRAFREKYADIISLYALAL